MINAQNVFSILPEPQPATAPGMTYAPPQQVPGTYQGGWLGYRPVGPLENKHEEYGVEKG